MRAVRIKTFGEPETLELVEVPDPPMGADMALVRCVALRVPAVNRTGMLGKGTPICSTSTHRKRMA